MLLCSRFVTLNVLVRALLEPEALRAGLWARFGNASRTRVEIAPSGAATLVYLNRA